MNSRLRANKITSNSSNKRKGTTGVQDLKIKICVSNDFDTPIGNATTLSNQRAFESTFLESGNLNVSDNSQASHSAHASNQNLGTFNSPVVSQQNWSSSNCSFLNEIYEAEYF